jgi:hypothetical protein
MESVLEAPVVAVVEAIKALVLLRWQDLPIETLQAIRADREQGGMTWNALEVRYNLIRTNGMSSYNGVKKLRAMESGAPVAHRQPAKPKAPPQVRVGRNALVDGAGI